LLHNITKTTSPLRSLAYVLRGPLLDKHSYRSLTLCLHFSTCSILDVQPFTHLLETRNITSYDTTFHQNELSKQPTHPWDLCFQPNLIKEVIQVDFEFKSFDHPETYHASKKSSLVRHRRKTTSSNSNSSLQLTITHLPYWRHQGFMITNETKSHIPNTIFWIW